MVVWEAVLWGLAGGLAVEGLELYARIHRARGTWSWRKPISQGLSAYVTSVVIRAGVGSVLSTAAASSGQISGAFAAMGLGVAAPVVIEKLARLVIAGTSDTIGQTESVPELDLGEPEVVAVAPALEEARQVDDAR